MKRQPRPHPPLKAHAASEVQPGIRERRKWVRFVLPELVTRLAWDAAGGTISHLVSLVNISADGAAVMMEVEPPAEGSVTIQFDQGDRAGVRIVAELVATQRMEFDRILASFRFDLPEGVIGILPQVRERRGWRRQVPRVRSAVLSWGSGEAPISVDAEIQDIGGGGAALRVSRKPPGNEKLWLRVGKEGAEAGPVESRMVGCSTDARGIHTVRLSFAELCPLSVFVAAMGLES